MKARALPLVRGKCLHETPGKVYLTSASLSTAGPQAVFTRGFVTCELFRDQYLGITNLISASTHGIMHVRPRGTVDHLQVPTKRKSKLIRTQILQTKASKVSKPNQTDARKVWTMMDHHAVMRVKISCGFVRRSGFHYPLLHEQMSASYATFIRMLPFCPDDARTRPAQFFYPKKVGCVILDSGVSPMIWFVRRRC